MRRLLSSLLLAAAAPSLVFAQSDEPPQPTEHPLLWRIESDPPSYLYGTIHVPDERVTALPTPVVEALSSCDVVVTELRMDRMAGLAAEMMLPEGESLDKILPEAVRAKLVARLEVAGLPVQALQRFKVWAVMATVVQLEYMDELRAGKQVLDQVIWEEARDNGAEGGALEVPEEQLDAFDGLTREEQVELLNDTLDQWAELRDKGETLVEGIVAEYLRGDLQSFTKFMEERSAYQRPELRDKVMARILDERNVRMADRIVEKMAAAPDTTFFFAVGAAHYPGELGILKLLEEKGVQVTRLPTAADRMSEILKRLRRIEQRLDGLEKHHRKAG